MDAVESMIGRVACECLGRWIGIGGRYQETSSKWDDIPLRIRRSCRDMWFRHDAATPGRAGHRLLQAISRERSAATAT